ncbi:MAG: hypothetical protein GY865_16645, partial [candidate division Zixibacteria bacterium]|nr:hypothetical protein [candidate division Zixibacteria bacterium]
MSPARFRWGLMFVAIGLAILLTNADVLGYDFWMELFSLWPMILIAIGLEKIFLHSKLRFISYLAPLLLVGTMVYAGFISEDGGAYESSYRSSRWSETIDSSVNTIEAKIDHYRSDIQIGKSRSNLIKARFDRFSRKPKIQFSQSDSVANLDIKYRRGGPGRIIVFGKRRFDNDWNLSFTDNSTLSLTCLGDDSNVDLNFKLVPLKELKVDNDDGEIRLEIGELVADVFAEIKGDDAVLRIRAPEGCGLKVDVSEANYIDYLESLNLTKVDNYYISENY